MRFTNCKCGSTNFEITRNGKMECVECGNWFNQFSAQHHKVMKPNGKHFFWVILTPHFIERFEENFMDKDIEIESLVADSLAIEKAATMKRTQGTRWNDKHIYWRYFFNPKRKRLEMEFISLTNTNYFTTKYHKDVEFVKVVF